MKPAVLDTLLWDLGAPAALISIVAFAGWALA